MNEIEVRDHGALTTRPVDQLLRWLAELEVGGASVVSMYLDARWDDEMQRDRVRLTIKSTLADIRRDAEITPEPERSTLDRDLGRAIKYAQDVINQRTDVGFEAVAGFFCEERDLHLEVMWHGPVQTSLRIGRRPHLVPLLRSANDFDLALVAVVETDEARILEVSLGGLASEDTIHGDVPDRVVRGGWGQLRIQKHIAHHIAHHHKEAARELVARFDGITAMRGRPPRVVLGGRDPMLAAFERQVPDRVLSHAIRATMDPQGTTDEILTKAHEALTDAVRRSDREALRSLSDAVAIGRGALGLDQVLSAVNGGRVRDLLIDRRFDVQGARCTRCDLLLSALPAENMTCRACSGVLEQVPLLDEMTRRAVLSSAVVHVLDGDDEFRRSGGVAATLRY